MEAWNMAMTRLYGPRPKLHKIGTGYCRRCAVLFFSQENMQNCCRQQEKRRAHPTGLNSVRENTSSTGLSSVCADLPTRRYLKHCQRVAMHTARWYDYTGSVRNHGECDKSRGTLTAAIPMCSGEISWTWTERSASTGSLQEIKETKVTMSVADSAMSRAHETA